MTQEIRQAVFQTLPRDSTITVHRGAANAPAILQPDAAGAFDLTLSAALYDELKKQAALPAPRGTLQIDAALLLKVQAQAQQAPLGEALNAAIDSGIGTWLEAVKAESPAHYAQLIDRAVAQFFGPISRFLAVLDKLTDQAVEQTASMVQQSAKVQGLAGKQEFKLSNEKAELAFKAASAQEEAGMQSALALGVSGGASFLMGTTGARRGYTLGKQSAEAQQASRLARTEHIAARLANNPQAAAIAADTARHHQHQYRVLANRSGAWQGVAQTAPTSMNAAGSAAQADAQAQAQVAASEQQGRTEQASAYQAQFNTLGSTAAENKRGQVEALTKILSTLATALESEARSYREVA